MVSLYHLLLINSLILPAFVGASKCVVKGQRRAWHTFSDLERREYIDAELCVMKLPPKVGLRSCRSVFDELQASHQILAAWNHFVGGFLPYHRYLMHVHEHFLKNDCGYTGYQPYWDEPLDAGNFTSSVVFDSATGFGGNGSGNDSCITTGPFANYTNSIGPGYLVTDHCIERDIDDVISEGTSQVEIDICNTNTTFQTFWPCLQSTPHSGGHVGVGGEMANPISSPGDPLFYLHHTWLDKVWWEWQAQNRSRVYDISGNNEQPPDTTLFNVEGGNGGVVGNGTNEPSYTMGDPGNTTTLDHVLSSLGLLPNATVRDVMDIGGGYLCYEYV